MWEIQLKYFKFSILLFAKNSKKFPQTNFSAHIMKTISSHLTKKQEKQSKNDLHIQKRNGVSMVQKITAGSHCDFWHNHMKIIKL